METHRCAPARGPYAHSRSYDCPPGAVNASADSQHPPPPPAALKRLAAAGIAEARAIIGVIALHATRDPAARRLLARVGDELAHVALDVEGALAVSGGDDA